MGLIGGMARTAVIAGTATAVGNRVSRRQANRWSQQDQSAYAPQPRYAAAPQYAPQYQQPPQPQYSAPPQYAAPPQYQASPPPAPAPAPPAPAESVTSEMLDQLRKLGEFHAQGILTDEEFAAQKARILAT